MSNNTDNEHCRYERTGSKNILTMFNNQIKAFKHVKDFHVSTSTLGERLTSIIVALDERFEDIRNTDKENVIDMKLTMYNVCEDEMALTAVVTEVGFTYSITNRRTKSSYSIGYKSTEPKEFEIVKIANIIRPEPEQSKMAINPHSFKSSIKDNADKLHKDYMTFTEKTDPEAANVLDEI